MNQPAASYASRRTRFQLTPLMDLLLIIVFAQFLEMRETANEQTRQVQDQRQALLDDEARWQRERERALAQRDAALAMQNATRRDAAQAIELVKQWLSIDGSDASDAILRGEAESRDSIARAIERSRQLASADPDTLIRFLVGHDELLKRAEIWTVHARDTGEIFFEASEHSQTFRLEANRQRERTTEVADQLFAAYKQWPQPKGLVVVLVSYDPRSVAGVYQPMVDAMPATLERWRADTPTSRFEFTVLGASTNARSGEQDDSPIEINDSPPTENQLPLKGNPNDA